MQEEDHRRYHPGSSMIETPAKSVAGRRPGEIDTTMPKLWQDTSFTEVTKMSGEFKG
jgi:hypothetical protein